MVMLGRMEGASQQQIDNALRMQGMANEMGGMAYGGWQTGRANEAQNAGWGAKMLGGLGMTAVNAALGGVFGGGGGGGGGGNAMTQYNPQPWQNWSLPNPMQQRPAGRM